MKTVGQTPSLPPRVNGDPAGADLGTGKAAPAVLPTAVVKAPTADNLGTVLRGVPEKAEHLLSDFIFHASAGATATAAPAAHVAPPGVGKFQTQRYHENFNKYTTNEQEHVNNLLIKTGSPKEIDYIMKAVAAGYSAVEVSKFADKIRGKSDAWMDKNLHASGFDNGDPGLKQQWSCSCVPTTAEIIRAEMDPIYALKVRGSNADISADDPRPGLENAIEAHGKGRVVGNHNIADEQRDVLEDNGGDAVERGKKGGKGITDNVKVLNTVSQWTGVTYEDHAVTSVDSRKSTGYPSFDKILNDNQNQQLADAFKKLDADLANGIPGALRITDTKGKSGHAVAVIGSTGTGANKTYIIHDPWDGKTVHVKASDLLKGKVDPAIAGWTEVSNVYTSK